MDDHFPLVTSLQTGVFVHFHDYSMERTPAKSDPNSPKQQLDQAAGQRCWPWLDARRNLRKRRREDWERALESLEPQKLLNACARVHLKHKQDATLTSKNLSPNWDAQFIKTRRLSHLGVPIFQSSNHGQRRETRMVRKQWTKSSNIFQPCKCQSCNDPDQPSV